MIIFVHAVKEEDDRNALARVVVMIAAVEEPVRIFRIVVLRIKREFKNDLFTVLTSSPSSVLIIVEPIR